MMAWMGYRGWRMLIIFLIWEGSCGCRSRPPQPQTARQVQAEILQIIAAPDIPSRINFYVSTSGNDRADGSAAHPWKTLEKAAAMVSPGVAVHVAPGEYQLNDAELKTPVSGTAAARIRYVSDAKWGAKLRSSKTGNSAVWWNQGDHVDIEGFDISGSGAAGIYNEGSHTRIIGNHIHDIPAPGCPDGGGAGINDGNYGGSDDDIIGNTVHDIGQYNLTCPRVHGIYHSNRGGHIINNRVFHNEGWGIHLWHAATNVIVAGNTVFSNAYGGILVGAETADFAAGAAISKVNDNTVVENNIVFQNGLRPDARGYGILEYGAVGTGNQYINNLVYQNSPDDMKVLGKNETGTIHADPQFVDYRPDGKGDYRLRPASPACSRGWRHSEC